MEPSGGKNILILSPVIAAPVGPLAQVIITDAEAPTVRGTVPH